MAMTKKEQAMMQSAIDRADTLAALRWTCPVERDVDIPMQGDSEGWDFNAYSMRVWLGWSSRIAHGEGAAIENSKYRSGSQGGRKMFSTEARAFAAMRHEIEKKAAADLLKVDRQIVKAMIGGDGSA